MREHGGQSAGDIPCTASPRVLHIAALSPVVTDDVAVGYSGGWNPWLHHRSSGSGDCGRPRLRAACHAARAGCTFQTTRWVMGFPYQWMASRYSRSVRGLMRRRR